MSLPVARRGADGRFHNPWPDSEPHRARDLLRLLRGQLFGKRVPTPARGTFATAAPTLRLPRGGDDELVATWVGHATALLQIAGVNVLTDPVFSPRAFPVPWMGPRRVMEPGIAIEELPPIDAFVVSHAHYDHLDRPAVKRLARAHPQATWIAPAGLGGHLRRWGAARVVELTWWESTDVGALRVTATPARHFSARHVWDRNRALWCGYALVANGRRALFVGDTAFHPAFGAIGERCGPFDLVLMPIGAYDPRWFMRVVHVDPEEAVQAYRDLVAPHAELRPPLMLGIHWGTFRLTDEPMDEPPRRVRERWRTAGLDASRLWIASFGETRHLE